ncbi:hypothetical protein [Terrabacter sp. RAF57]|uniref:hypothetical protein n=1 Tax=Terrabacter sp. RAF57 TaxID=3233063 RepID=UPI003F9BE396
MITIEHLQILFDAERERDEAVFARLFAQHTARLDAVRRGADEDAQQAASDRSLGSGGWS